MKNPFDPIVGTMEYGADQPPTVPGLYAVEVFCGWKLLDWNAARGWHMAGVCKWNADVPTQWIGPLPARKHEGRKGSETPAAQVFDL